MPSWHLVKRGRKWSVVLEVVDEKGQHRQVWHALGVTTRRHAETAAAVVVARWEGGPEHRTQRYRVGEWLDRYLGDRARSVRPKTLQGYRDLLPYLAPLGAVRLQDLTAPAIGTWLGALADHGGRGGRPLSGSTVRHAYALLRAALEAAVRQGGLGANPCRAVPAPRVARTDRQVLEAASAQRLFGALEGHRLRSFLYLLLFGGLRPGEALGLRWQDLDIRTGTLMVSHSLSRGGGTWVLTEPKTARSRRRLDLSGPELAILAEHRQRQDAERAAAGSLWQDNGLVFCTAIGTPLDARNVAQRVLGPALARAGLPPMRLYDLRHSCATLLLLGGVNPKVVADRLGHASVATTLDTYSHVLPGLQEAASATLRTILGASRSRIVATGQNEGHQPE